MAKSTEQGMQTFDQALLKLYKEGKISKENAIKYADSKNNVGLEIRLTEEMGHDSEQEQLTIQPDDID